MIKYKIIKEIIIHYTEIEMKENQLYHLKILQER